MMYLYAHRDCFACHYAMNMMQRKGIKYLHIKVDRQEIADKVLQAYPQMKCDTCVLGVALPFAVDIDNEKLIGAMPDLLRYIGSDASVGS